jgi:hypothetical protein
MGKITIAQILDKVTNKENFKSLQDFIDFACYFLDYIEKNKQAIIVSQNEHIYNFFQYNKEADYRVTRPFNSNLLYSYSDFLSKANELVRVIKELKRYREEAEINDRSIINRTIYTIQQSIGFALDALPASQTNTARKLNGDYFELLILILLRELGIDAKNGVVQIPVKIDGQVLFSMSYQHDLVITDNEGNVNLIGSVKTTSKDRIDKIFIDKFLYNKLTETSIPHIAIFLHDVQRKKTKDPRKFGINTTFLSGHFKGYTVKLNPLDGVYYFDPRPIMQTDTLLSQHIQTFDNLICEDIWRYLD